MLEQIGRPLDGQLLVQPQGHPPPRHADEKLHQRQHTATQHSHQQQILVGRDQRAVHHPLGNLGHQQPHDLQPDGHDQNVGQCHFQANHGAGQLAQLHARRLLDLLERGIGRKLQRNAGEVR